MAEHAFTGGAKLEARLREVAAGTSGELKVGFMAGATYPDGTPVAAVAFWNEFGNGRAPPRPFFRNMIAQESGTWVDKITGLAKASKYDGSKVLGAMGVDISYALQVSIIKLTSPPLAMSTILARAKGAKHGAINSPTIAKPLIHTSHMKDSITYEVA